MNGKQAKPRVRRSGQVLVEFAIISFMLVFLVAGLLGIIVLALGSFQNNIAAENAGRLLDAHPLFIKENFVALFTLDPDDPDPFFEDDDFENVTARQVYRFLNEYEVDGNGINGDSPVLYDESLLILTPAAYRNSSDLPAINQALLGQYIFDPDLVPDGESEQGAYRFPGAVVRNERTNEQTVLIPLLREEEIDGVDGIDRSFHVESTDPDFFYPVFDDWVAPVVIGKLQDGDGFEFRVIMFHPSQPAATLKIEYDDDGNQYPVEANDADEPIRDIPADSDYELEPPTSNNPDFGASASRGEFGLGESLAFATTVRPYRAVFETSSLFRMGASLNPIVVKYEYEEDGDPGPTLTDASGVSGGIEDQSLDFEQLVIDRFAPELRRYIVDPMPPNDFSTALIQLLPNDDGVWRVSVSAEFERVGSVTGTGDHRLELRLYKNGVFERVIARFNEPFDSNSEILLREDALTTSTVGDVLQVRVFSERPAGESYEVRLTGESETNWVSFERIGD